MSAEDPFAGDWGETGADHLHSTEAIACHTYNHSLDHTNWRRSAAFVRARALRLRHEAPDLRAIWVIYDDRGQHLSGTTRDRLRSAIGRAADHVLFVSESHTWPSP